MRDRHNHNGERVNGNNRAAIGEPSPQTELGDTTFQNGLLGGLTTLPKVRDCEKKTQPPAFHLHSTVAGVLDELQQILGALEDAGGISHREYSFFESKRGSINSVVEAAAVANSVRQKIQGQPAEELTALDNFIERYGSLQSLCLSYPDFVGVAGSSEIVVPGRTVITLDFIPTAPREYHSGRQFVFGGFRKGGQTDPVVLHRKGSHQTYVPNEPLNAGDIITVKIVGQLQSATLLKQVREQLDSL